MKLSEIILITVMFFILISFTPLVYAQDDSVCAVYFSGVGCPHCAKTDPIIFEELLNEKENFIVIEYEVFQLKENAPLMVEYDSSYNSGIGVPLMFFDNQYLAGDKNILEGINGAIEKPSKCALAEGSTYFNDLNLNDLPKTPKIWSKDRILINDGGSNEKLNELISSDNFIKKLNELNYEVITPKTVPLSGKHINFENAVKLEGWIFQWNGEKVEDKGTSIDNENNDVDDVEKLTIGKLISLAAVDAVNPCALAVLILMLVTIAAYNPGKKKKILLAGLAFTFAVFVTYLIYGLIIIKFFQVVQSLTFVKIWLYKILGIIAIGLGILNIKDFIKYKPGSFGTEMPISLRPKVKRIITGVTSPKGALLVGLFVTLFLLPCTIGPYVIAGGILSAMDILKTIPLLLLYNLIFVLPMLIITAIIYFGFTKVEDVSGWKDKNIKRLHLVAGIIMFLLGIAMFFGWV